MAWGSENPYIIFDWGTHHLVGRFSTLGNAQEYVHDHKKSYQTWKIYKEV